MKVRITHDWKNSYRTRFGGSDPMSYKFEYYTPRETELYVFSQAPEKRHMKILFDFLDSIDYGGSTQIQGDDFREKPFGKAGRIKHENLNFNQRCNEGEIIVSPYKRYSGTISPKLDEEISRRVIDYTHKWWQDPNVFFEDAPFAWTEISVLGKESWWLWPHQLTITDYFGERMALEKGTSLPVVQITSDTVLMSDVVGKTPQDLYDEIYSYCENIEINGKLFQSTLANANAGDLDALTFIAELPKTVESIVDGLLLIKKMLVDFKSKELYISKAHVKRAKKSMQMDRSKKQFLSRKQFVAAGGNPRDYQRERKTFINNIDKDISELHKGFYLKSFALEAAEEIASVWLNYRYNIMPNVYTIQDSLKVISHVSTIYRTTRKMLMLDPFDFSGYGDFVGLNATHQRAFIKRKYGSNFLKLSEFGELLGTDVLVTAFELIPIWGIVIDWFASVTDFLRSINYNPKHLDEGCTVSNRIEIDGRIATEKGNIDVKFNYYQRFEVSNPYMYLDIYFSFDLNLQQKLDLLSFGLLGNRGKLKSYAGT